MANDSTADTLHTCRLAGSDCPPCSSASLSRATLLTHATASSCGACQQIYDHAEDGWLPNTIVRAFRETASLPRSISEAVGQDAPAVPLAAFVGAVANCTNTIIGAGTLAVPKTFGMTGLVSYHILVVVILAFTFLSLHWLVAVVDSLPPSVPKNYEGVANHYLGARWSIAISIAFFGGGIALTMAYIILITTSLAPILVELGFGSLAAMETVVRLVAGVGLCLPLTMLRDISGLRFTSTIAMFAMLYAVAFVTCSGLRQVIADGPADSVELVSESTEIFNAIAMSISAYSCHIAVMPIYESLGPARTPRVMMKVVMTSLFISWALYEAIGLAGYLHFGAPVSGNVLTSLSSGREPNLFMVIATVSVSITLIFSVPIIVWPLRSCILSTVQMCRGEADMDPTDMEWRVTTALVMATVLAAAAFFPDVKTALSVVGSLGGAFIVFIYPAAFHLAVVQRVPPAAWRLREHAPHLLMMAMGVLVGCLCLFFAFKSSLA